MSILSSCKEYLMFSRYLFFTCLVCIALLPSLLWASLSKASALPANDPSALPSVCTSQLEGSVPQWQLHLDVVILDEQSSYYANGGPQYLFPGGGFCGMQLGLFKRVSLNVAQMQQAIGRNTIDLTSYGGPRVIVAGITLSDVLLPDGYNLLLRFAQPSRVTDDCNCMITVNMPM